MNRKAVKIKRFNKMLKVLMVWIAILVFTVLTLEIYVRMRHAYYTRKNREILYKEAGNKANEFIETKNMHKGMQYYDDFTDLSSIFDNSGRNDFYDEGHTGPYSVVDTGYNIAEIVSSQMIKK